MKTFARLSSVWIAIGVFFAGIVVYEDGTYPKWKTVAISAIVLVTGAVSYLCGVIEGKQLEKDQ